MVVNKITVTLISILILAAVLRFYQLGVNPPSPYWEEAAIGFDAYSILKTGRDFHGNPWPLAAFESFGDWKPSLYFYTAVPAVALFGLNTFAVRFPSALFGTLTVLLIYLLFLKIGNWKLGILAALLLAVSPWHLQLSRAGFEANLGLFLLVLGYFFSPALALSMYSYHADRILAPLLFLVFTASSRIKQFWRQALICLILVLPLMWQLRSPVLRQRFNETSAFSSLDPIIKSNQLIAEDGNTRLAKIIHHRFWQYGQIFLRNYFDHFSFKYLFVSGDSNPRHSTQKAGGLYLIQVPFLLYGILLSLKRRHKQDWLFLAWLFLAPVPAALTTATPHALRSLGMLVPLTYFTSLGVIKTKRFLMILAAFVLMVEAGRYLNYYYRYYSRDYAQDWQFGYQPMIESVAANEVKYDHVYITRAMGRPSIYYWFYTKTDPRLVQSMNNLVPKDQGEYLEFGKIKFNNGPYLPHSLIVSSQDNKFIIYEN